MLEKTISPESPLSRLVECWPAALVAFIVSVIATRLCEKIAPRLGIVDKPDNLVKTHGKTTPYLGGIAIFLGILFGMLVSFAFVPERYYGSVAFRWGFGILAAGAIASVIGALDDIFDIRPWQKITGQVAAAVILVAVGITPKVYSLAGPVGLVIDTAFVIVFVLGATNSLNLLDGLDGLCAGVTAIMTVGMMALGALMAVQYEDPANVGWLRFVLCLTQLSAVCGFLIFNYPRRGGARIFMGDAGSLLLGLNMAVLMILFAEEKLQFWLGSIVIFGLPILDTAIAFARRFINKRPLFIPDRGHIYDQMVDAGLAVKKTVNLCYVFSAGYALAGVAVSQLPLLWAIVASCAVAVTSWLIVWRKGYLKMAGIRGAGSPKV
ncbi:MAG: undecaprenyl/decaprenyl-phosphate alpha-N-acetylglucosaminyl 1-phosphate transferase [Sedimentisphaerales bacterium]|nr:undecaprenyl/decaprenyl-phosphate alpha-N-acetylglucosaminyl 1-phosphate transferase [Sedimentisphaerales bacterium]